jgi:hypothetical protein
MLHELLRNPRLHELLNSLTQIVQILLADFPFNLDDISVTKIYNAMKVKCVDPVTMNVSFGGPNGCYTPEDDTFGPARTSHESSPKQKCLHVFHIYHILSYAASTPS